MTVRTPIAIAKPKLGEEEAAAARRAILSGWVTQGPEVAAFETEFAAYVGAPHAVAVSNCTTALHLALHALGVGAGDEVITASHSFIATANAITYCGAKPVFVDIDPQTYNIDPTKIEAAITPRTKAIMPVHQMGMPCDMPAIMAIAARHNLPVIEDAACAIGSQIQIDGAWQRIGACHGGVAGKGKVAGFEHAAGVEQGAAQKHAVGYEHAVGHGHAASYEYAAGHVACFSFHPRKLITTGDGGMLTTRDPELAKKFRLLRQHAMSVPDTVRHAAKSVIFEEYVEVGFNYRMTDIQAAVGRVQLGRLPDLIGQRVHLAEEYARGLSSIKGLKAPFIPAYARPNFQSYPVRVLESFPHKRDTLMQALLERGIHTRRGIMNSHQEPAYAAHPQARNHTNLAASEAARDGVILLPLHHELSPEDQSFILAQLQALSVQ